MKTPDDEALWREYLEARRLAEPYASKVQFKRALLIDLSTFSKSGATVTSNTGIIVISAARNYIDPTLI
jgi:hypothetical protein